MKLLWLLALLSTLTLVQFGVQDAQAQTNYAYEERDAGVAPTKNIRRTNYHAPTPLSVPGASTITTVELKALLEKPGAAVVVDVLGGNGHNTIPGAHWLPGAGLGDFGSAESTRFADALNKLTKGDKSQALVILCLSWECWLSYNASLRAVELGYTRVLWFRGGTDAWKGAGLDTKRSVAYAW